MRSFALASLAAATVSAGTVSVDFTKLKHGTAFHITQRDTITLEALNNVSAGGYFAEFEIGTPGQKLTFHLDTGSSDTWVNSVDTNLCNSVSLQRQYGECYKVFNPDDSKTFDVVDEGGFSIKYLDGNNIQGDYFNDTVTIGKTEVKNQQLGLALNSTRTTGLMGLGFKANVASSTKYPTIVDNMVDQGLIDTAAFSLYLNDLDSDTGTVLFGGLDKEKFIGELVTLDIVPETSTKRQIQTDITHYNVEMKGFTATTPKKVKSVKLPSISSNAQAILDSGSTTCLLPDDLVSPIWDAYDVVYLDELKIPMVDCAYRDEDGSFNFEFDGKTIEVPLKEMIIDSWSDIQYIFDDPSVSSYFDGWDSVCMFGMSPSSEFGVDSDDFVLLGDTFLRSAYVVYDLANEQIGLAQANLQATKSDIVELKSSSKSIPKVTGVASQGSKSTSTATRPTVTVYTSNGASDDDNDSAAVHFAPAVISALMMSLGAIIALV